MRKRYFRSMAVAVAITVVTLVGVGVVAAQNSAAQWQVDLVTWAKDAGIISRDHDPLEKADKWFVLSVLRNSLATKGQSAAVKSGGPAIPPAEAGLPQIEAEEWLKMSDESWFLEGPAFDRAGNLYFVDFAGKIFKVTPDKKVEVIYDSKGKALLASISIHKDGRLFVSDFLGARVFAMNNDGTGITDILTRDMVNPPLETMDDIVFDPEGNFYATEFAGSAVKRTGRVIRVSADFKKVDVVLDGLMAPSGISLSTTGKSLVVSEYSGNRMLSVALLDDGITPNPMGGTNAIFHFSGPVGLDSMAMDEAGNIYQAMVNHGRVFVGTSQGEALANVLIHGREDGKFLMSTNLALKPGTNEGYILASGKGGAAVFKFNTLAHGKKLYSHQ